MSYSDLQVIEAVQLLGVLAEAVIDKQGLVRQVVLRVTLDPTATQPVRDVITSVVTRQQVLALGTARRVFTDQIVNDNVVKTATGQVATGLLADVPGDVQLDGTGSNVTSNVRLIAIKAFVIVSRVTATLAKMAIME